MKVTIDISSVPPTALARAKAMSEILADGEHAIAGRNGDGSVWMAETSRSNRITIIENELTYEGRRHALSDHNNVVGAFMEGLIGGQLWVEETRRGWGDARRLSHTQEPSVDITVLPVISAESTTPERPWWDIIPLPAQATPPRY